MLKKLILATLLVGAMTAPSAFAVSTVKLFDGPGNTGGGEFNAMTSANGNFITFCLEASRGISLGEQNPYYYTISDTTLGTVDPLSRATAWLYNQFLNGTLAGYDYTPDINKVTHRNSANNLQNAIWFLENEGGVNNIYVQTALSATGLTLATKDASTANEWGIRVMNVWQNYDQRTGVYSGDKQDQLIRIPRVPDGGTTLAMLGMSMGFVAFASRRLRR